MANQPKTPLVSFRTPRKREIEQLAVARGITVTELLNEWVDTCLGGQQELTKP